MAHSSSLFSSSVPATMYDRHENDGEHSNMSVKTLSGDLKDKVFTLWRITVQRRCRELGQPKRSPSSTMLSTK